MFCLKIINHLQIIPLQIQNKKFMRSYLFNKINDNKCRIVNLEKFKNNGTQGVCY